MKNKKQESKKELDKVEPKGKPTNQRELPTSGGRYNNRATPRDYGSNIDRSYNSPEQDWAETSDDF